MSEGIVDAHVVLLFTVCFQNTSAMSGDGNYGIQQGVHTRDVFISKFSHTDPIQDFYPRHVRLPFNWFDFS